MELSDIKAVGAALTECGLEFSSVDRYRDGVVVKLASRFETATWSYDGLVRLSARLGTTRIYFRYSSGWGGSEVTPGDPATFDVFIGAHPDGALVGTPA